MKRHLISLAAAALGALALAAPASAAEFGLESFDVTFTANPQGEGEAQAGAHPYAMITSFAANVEKIGEEEFPVELTKDLEIFQVPGLAGDQTAVPPCPAVDFLTIQPGVPDRPECPDSTAVGVAQITIGEKGKKGESFPVPLYNLEPAPGSVARLGFVFQQVPVAVDVHLTEEAPYRLLASTANISQVLEFFAAKVTIWGVPADPIHDEERGACRSAASPEGAKCSAGVPPRPFLTLPRACEGPLATEYELDSWQKPGVWKEGFALTHDDAEPPNPQGMSGCGQLGFGPTTEVEPTTAQAESSSGIDVEIDVEDLNLKNPDADSAWADIEEVITRFPAGMTANPSAAEGLGVCSEAQFEAEELEAEGCPAASTLGTVEAETPLLENHPLKGTIYLASQYENPFGSLLAFYLVVKDPGLGILIKQAGKVETDEATGQLVSSFGDLPQFPLSHVRVHLRSGPRAPLITPPTCGTYTTEMKLVPTSGAEPLVDHPSFQIDSGPGGAPCPPGGTPPLSPGFEASSVNNAAGAHSPFQMRLTRQDGTQELTRFSATLPPGIVPKLAGVGKCPDAAIAAAKLRSGREELASPSCPATSLIGHVIGGAGVGSALTYVPGSVYLAGPFGGHPLSAVAIVPAVAGPFDVGTVVTRVALDLNPITYLGEIDGAASDPIPHILKGIPLALRDLRVFVDRPDFMLNPTGCSPTETTAQISGAGADFFNPADDPLATRISRYQAASCASLAFRPNLSLQLKGGTKRGDHPALHSKVTYPKGPGYANVGKAIVTLPKTEFIDNAHINNPCTRVQFNANACPPGSVLGYAKATTPLLDEPLEGPVYFRSNGGERNLPDVVADLHGLVRITLVGKVDSKNARIRTTFDQVPDAPVSSFELNLFGGKRGLLVNSANLCAAKRRAKVQLTGQNGRRYDTEPAIKTGCKKQGAKKHKRR